MIGRAGPARHIPGMSDSMLVFDRAAVRARRDRAAAGYAGFSFLKQEGRRTACRPAGRHQPALPRWRSTLGSP
jgi:hypothetical protein